MCTLCLGESGDGDLEAAADSTIRILLGETLVMALVGDYMVLKRRVKKLA